MSQPDVVNNFEAGGSRHARDLAKSTPAIRRAATPSTARARVGVGKSKKRARVQPLGPTPERLAKGDVQSKTGGFHRSVPPIERLRDQGKLAAPGESVRIESELSTAARRENNGCFEAAEKLARHYDGLAIGVKAQDLNRIVGGASDDLAGEENWVHHHREFTKACRLMGFSAANPRRGCARIVVAIVCEGMTVGDAAIKYIGRVRKDVAEAQALDRLREGLYELAILWRMC